MVYINRYKKCFIHISTIVFDSDESVQGLRVKATLFVKKNKGGEFPVELPWFSYIGLQQNTDQGTINVIRVNYTIDLSIADEYSKARTFTISVKGNKDLGNEFNLLGSVYYL